MESLHLIFATLSQRATQPAVGFPQCPRVRADRDETDEGDHLIGVATCREGDDVLPLPVSAASVPTDRYVRASPDAIVPARGIVAEPGRGHEPVGAASYRRQPGSAAYIKLANARRRGEADDEPELIAAADAEEIEGEANLTPSALPRWKRLRRCC